MSELTSEMIDRLLAAVGDLLAVDGGEEIGIVVVGGASLSAMGWVPRVTYDVDVIARAERRHGHWVPIAPKPLPERLVAAVDTVARDYSLPTAWLNAAVGDQWPHGLPPRMAEGLTWRQYSALHVGFAGRDALIALKLFAAVDRSPGSVHFQDLLALAPSRSELAAARQWVLTQDAGDRFPELVQQVLEVINERLG